jgi:hypothetical protein
MVSSEEVFAKTLAAADGRRAQVGLMFLDTVAVWARELLIEQGDATAAWALLSRRIAEQLDLISPIQKAAAEMLAEVAIQGVEDDVRGEPPVA